MSPPLCGEAGRFWCCDRYRSFNLLSVRSFHFDCRLKSCFEPNLIVQYATPDILDISTAHQGLNAQLRFGFKQNLELRLFVERTIIAAVIEIDTHRLLVLYQKQPRTDAACFASHLWVIWEHPTTHHVRGVCGDSSSQSSSKKWLKLCSTSHLEARSAASFASCSMAS